jgi:general L-amino acid transport system permease protein
MGPGRRAELMGRLLSNEKFRGYLLQAVALVLVLGVVISFVVTAQTNLAARGITSGFSFLDRATGWDISFSVLEYTINDPYWWVILIGVLNTFILGISCIVIATILGTVIGIARLSNNLVLESASTIYVEIFRNVPLILQGFFWYAVITHFPPPRQAHQIADSIFLTSRGLYVPTLNISGEAFAMLFAAMLLAALALFIAYRQPFGTTLYRHREKTPWAALGFVILVAVALVLAREGGASSPVIDTPYLKGLNFRGGFRVSPEFAAIATAIVIFGSAYIAEIVRGGFLSVPNGQIEAARSLGLKPWPIYWKVRIPLALRTIIPPLGNQYVFLMKSTTIGIAIGYNDLFMITSTSINQSGQTIELLFIMMACFLFINYSITSVMNAVNRSMALKGHEAKT